MRGVAGRGRDEEIVAAASAAARQPAHLQEKLRDPSAALLRRAGAALRARGEAEGRDEGGGGRLMGAERGWRGGGGAQEHPRAQLERPALRPPIRGIQLRSASQRCEGLGRRAGGGVVCEGCRWRLGARQKSGAIFAGARPTEMWPLVLSAKIRSCVHVQEKS